MYLDLTLKKWMEVHDQSGKIYNPNKQIRFNTLRTKKGRGGGGGGVFQWTPANLKIYFQTTFLNNSDTHINSSF